jgi:Holliday junction DNA helicase RuvA
MIASLKGTLAASSTDHAVIDVGGVGYLVLASTRTLALLGAVGNAVSVQTEMQVREDAITLYGFATVAERDWFRLLTSVQGVGGRVALAILSTLSPEELQTAIARADKAMIARANGVGPKLALRIATELKDKAGALSPGPGVAPLPASGGYAADAVSALMNLGFRPGDANSAVAAAEGELGEGASLDALVRLALKKSAKV